MRVDLGGMRKILILEEAKEGKILLSKIRLEHSHGVDERVKVAREIFTRNYSTYINSF